MIRTVCTVCDAEIEVPQAGHNTCPACGRETVCFSPPPRAFTEEETGVLLLHHGRVARARGFVRGFVCGAALAAAAYWFAYLAG